MGSTPSTRLDRWLPPGLSDDDLPRVRYLVRAWIIASPAVLVSLLVYLLNASWGQAAYAGILLPTGLFTVWYVRRGGSWRKATHCTIGVALFSFSGSSLAQTPADLTNLSFLAVLPLISSFLLGWRATRVWIAVAILVALTALALADFGFTLPFVDHAPFFSQAVNITLMLIVIGLFVRAFVTMREQAHEQLRDADRAKSTLLATVSHEIRTPMNAVLGMTELLLGDADDPIQRERLGILKRSGGRLLQIVNDVLDGMKIEANKLEIEHVRFDLATLIGDLALLYRPQAAQRGVTLVIEHDLGLQSASGDPLRLSQVLGNLLDNAVKYTERGRITLTVRQVAPEVVRFVVDDTGPGIDGPTLANLFTPYQQRAGWTTRRYGGTGLGLSLARSLVELMGGRLEVHSTVGVGTRFSFELALEPSALALVAAEEVWPESRGHRVLIVDDNPLNVAVAAGLLTRAGCEVESAASGQEAIERTTAGTFALVLMDLYMPDMDGIEATRRIHALSPTAAAIPIVGVTASAIPEELAACRDAGMLDVVTKPVTPAKLRDLLALAA